MDDNSTNEQAPEVVDRPASAARNGGTAKVKKSKAKPVDRFADGGDVPGGAQSASVAAAQGLLGVPVTSRLDHATKAALRAAQGRAGLPVNGRLDVATRNYLGV